ncbi:MAG: biotin--protein ligase [archaeon]
MDRPEEKKGTATRKIPGGKLVRLDISFSDSIISCKITGDFFLHPEDAINPLETSLLGLSFPLDEKKASERLKSALRKADATLIGATAEEIASILMEAATCDGD